MALRVRSRAIVPGLALALALAGCNAQHSGELLANVASPELAAAGPASAQAVSGPASAQAEDVPVKIELAANGAPLPPVRPDFAKLAAEKAQQAQAQTAQQPQQGQPASSAQAQSLPEAASAEGSSVMAMAPVAPSAPAPTGIFSLFAQPAAAPAEGVQLASAPSTVASDAPVERASLGAYERRVAGDAALQPSTAFKIAPAAVIEVAGVTQPARPSPNLVPVAPQIAGSFGAAGGQNWRPAYDDVVTNCFRPDLRAALENIARHFNSEVLVTSGARDRGRRNSLHRSCRAADIRIVGVSPGTIARYAAGVPGIKGVGTYRRVAVTHIDTRESEMAWRY